MADEQGDRHAERDRLSPRWCGVAGVILGVMVCGAIIYTRDDAKPISDALGNGVTAFLGFVVAGWGITQAEIAQQTRNATNAQADAAAAAVVAANKQVEMAHGQLTHSEAVAQRAQQDAEFHRKHSELTLEATVKQRLDAQAPRVMIRTCQPAGPDYEWRDPPAGAHPPGIPLPEWQTENPGKYDLAEYPRNIAVRITVGIQFILIGDIPARVEWDQNLAEGEVIALGGPLILTPEDREATVRWQRIINANHHHSQATSANQEVWGEPWRPKFLVHDLALNTCDEFVFSGNVFVMRRNGSWMTLTPGASDWGEIYGMQLPRKYDYFQLEEGKRELGREVDTKP